MQIERLAPVHAPAYRALMLEAYALHPDAFTSSVRERQARPLDWWETRLSEADGAHEQVFGAFDEGRLVGVAGLGFQEREKVRHKCTLFGMYVRDTHRHGGLGRALVLAVLDAARKREGVALVQLTVTHGNRAAESLYRQMGFIAFGTEPMAVVTAEGHVAKVHMWRPLAG